MAHETGPATHTHAAVTVSSTQDQTLDFLTVPEVARDAGVTLATVHNWLKYHRYMEWRRLLGRPVVHRDEYARFKREHAELVVTKL